MQGHSAANIIPVAAANRIGTETVTPGKENGGQSSSLSFYGSSFLTDETGDVLAKASRDKEEIIYAEYDFAQIRENRLSWGLFRDRRPECYKAITE
jgi:N-carbamoylputrescine amidase